MDLNTTFSLRLKDAREKNELTQAQLAKFIGVGVSTVGMWESYTRIPLAKELIKLSESLNVSIDFLLGTTTLSHKEKKTEIQSLFDTLSPLQQKQVIGYIQGLTQNDYTTNTKNKGG